jgi:hypothetical protein
LVPLPAQAGQPGSGSNSNRDRAHPSPTANKLFSVLAATAIASMLAACAAPGDGGHGEIDIRAGGRVVPQD